MHNFVNNLKTLSCIFKKNKVCDWINFNICIYLWNNHYNQNNEHSLITKVFFMSPCNSYCRLSPSPQTAADLLSVTINYFLFSIILYKWNHTVCTPFGKRVSGFFKHNYFNFRHSNRCVLHFIVVLICTSLMTNKSFCMCFFAISASSLVMCLFQLFTYF